MTAEKIDSFELDIMKHTLGLNKGTVPYRNYFMTEPNSPDGKTCCQLVARGLMQDHGPKTFSGGLHRYSVTDAGVQSIKEHSLDYN